MPRVNTRPTVTVDPKSVRFGVEVETVHSVPRSVVANAIAKALCDRWNKANPNDTRSLTSYDVDGGDISEPAPHADPTYRGGRRKWRLVHDASISPSGSEMVTPVLSGDDDVDTLQHVVRAMHDAGCRANASCGVHVHVDGAGFKARPIAVKWLVRTWSRFETLIGLAVDLMPARKRTYCVPVEGTTSRGHDGAAFVKRLEAIDPRTMTIDDVNRAWYGHAYSGAEHYHTSRYHALNLHALWNKGTVEFRLFNGTTHAGKIKAYVYLCRCFAAHALNATSARKGERDFDPSWTRYAIWGLLKNLGMSGDYYATAREHLLTLGKGAAGFKSAASYHAWCVAHGRVEGEGPRATYSYADGEFCGPVARRDGAISPDDAERGQRHMGALHAVNCTCPLCCRGVAPVMLYPDADVVGPFQRIAACEHNALPGDVTVAGCMCNACRNRRLHNDNPRVWDADHADAVIRDAEFYAALATSTEPVDDSAAQ